MVHAFSLIRYIVLHGGHTAKAYVYIISDLEPTINMILPIFLQSAFFLLLFTSFAATASEQ